MITEDELEYFIDFYLEEAQDSAFSFEEKNNGNSI